MKKVLLFVLCLGLCGCATISPSHEEMANLDYGKPLTIDYKNFLKETMGECLIDPYSAVYEFEEPFEGCFTETLMDGGKTYAGQIVLMSVNAKNRMGGYVGRKNWGYVFKDNQCIKQFSYDDVLIGAGSVKRKEVLYRVKAQVEADKTGQEDEGIDSQMFKCPKCKGLLYSGSTICKYCQANLQTTKK